MKVLSKYHNKPHPVHKTWFKEVGDVEEVEDSLKTSLSEKIHNIIEIKDLDDDYDVILCEDIVSTRKAVIKKILNPDIILIRLIADQGFYDTAKGHRKGHEQKILDRFVDGMLANSEFIKKHAQRTVDTPIEVATPYVPELDEYLAIEKENYDTQNILFIGYNYPHKDVDMLAEAVEDLDVTLNIVGKGHREYDQENVVTHGWVEDLEPIMKKCDLYVHPGDGEAFGVAPAEAMAAGIPTIVTEFTGIKEDIEQINGDLVAELSADDIREKIVSYYSREPSERAELGSRSQEYARKYSKENSVQEMKEALTKLVEKEK